MYMYIYIYVVKLPQFCHLVSIFPNMTCLASQRREHLPHIFRIMRLTIGWAVERIEPSVKEQRRCSCRRATVEAGQLRIGSGAYGLSLAWRLTLRR